MPAPLRCCGKRYPGDTWVLQAGDSSCRSEGGPPNPQICLSTTVCEPPAEDSVVTLSGLLSWSVSPLGRLQHSPP